MRRGREADQRDRHPEARARCDANTIGTTHSAQISIAVLRAGVDASSRA